METDPRMEIVERRSYQVVKANEIIQEARYDLSAKELKALSYLISLVKPSDQKDQWYETSIKEYCAVRGIDKESGKNYTEVKRTLKQLRDKSFWLQKEDGSEVTVGWLGKAEVNRGSGKVRIKFDADLQKYIIGLFGNYTQYELLATLPMKSAYSIRIYELIKSYSYKDTEFTISIDELKKKLGCEEAYKEFRDFKRKVLEVAVKEINLYTDLDISYEKILSGKTVSKIIFYFKKKDMTEHIAAYERSEKELDSGQIPGQMSISDFM